jgi:hypothetical protein
MAQSKQVKGVCDAHPMVEQSLHEIKTDIKEIRTSQEAIKEYIIKKKAENGIQTITAQQRDTTWDKRRNWAIVLIAIVSIALSLYTTVIK